MLLQIELQLEEKKKMRLTQSKARKKSDNGRWGAVDLSYAVLLVQGTTTE